MFDRADGTSLEFDTLWALLPLGSGVYFTAGIADEARSVTLQKSAAELNQPRAEA